jgi:urease accessory protein
MHQDLMLMLLADARLPVAGHTQSGTVESALAHGLTASDVPGYLRTRLRSVTLVEAGTAVVARHFAIERTGLADVDVEWAARTPSAALRGASRGQGKTLRRLAGRLWPESVEPLASVAAPSRATVLGAIAGHLGLGAGRRADGVRRSAQAGADRPRRHHRLGRPGAPGDRRAR